MTETSSVLGKLLLITALFLSIAATGVVAQDRLLVDSLDMTVGGERTLNLSVQNRLSTQDDITLTFKGRAVENGLVQVSVDESSSKVTCNSDTSCVVTVDAQSSREVEVTFNAGTSNKGQSTAIIEGTSQKTGLSGKEELTISVDPLTSSGEVAAPGMTGTHIIISSLIAGLLLLAISRLR